MYLVGERRVGKSSLLNALDFPVERQRFGIPDELLFAHLDMQLIAGCDETVFLEYLLEEISEKLGSTAGPPSRRALDQIAKRLGRDQRLVLLLDEFSVLVHNPKIPPDLLEVLRSWSSKFRVSIIGAFREASLQKITDGGSSGSPFLNIFDKIYIGPLLPEDAKDLVETPAASIGAPFEDAEIEYIFDLAGYLPLFLQMACYHLLELKSSKVRGKEIRTRLGKL
jgi:hypothetical protein